MTDQFTVANIDRLVEEEKKRLQVMREAVFRGAADKPNVRNPNIQPIASLLPSSADKDLKTKPYVISKYSLHF